MKNTCPQNIQCLIALCFVASAAIGAGSNTPLLPNGWHVHDMARPKPVKVTAGASNADAPSDAIVLFDGTNLDKWVSKTGDPLDHLLKERDLDQWLAQTKDPAKWALRDGYMEINKASGSIMTKEAFGDIQLHIEWAVPEKIEYSAQKRGNSGIFMMSLYELQIMDAWDNPAYADGMAGAVYGQTPALVNAAKKPGQWQTYDILFNAPVFKDGKLEKPAYVTIIWNGVVVQNHTEILGPTRHQQAYPYAQHSGKLPLMLQNHGSAVRFRNIWVRNL